MNAIVQFVLSHGYIVLFGGVFARQAGLPVPAPLFLLAGGALAASGKLILAIVIVLVLGVVACVLADWIWYEAGRFRGKKVLHLLDHFVPNPDAADQTAKKAFARFGPPVLVFDKFVPGLDAVAPPQAGTSGTSRFQFLSLEATGAALYSILYAGLGYVFSHHLDRVAAYTGRAGTLLGGLLIGILAVYCFRKLARSHFSPHQYLFALTSPNKPMESERVNSSSR